MKPTPYDYHSVLASFFDASDLAPEKIAPFKSMAESAAHGAMQNPDIVYMPGFKVLDFLSSIVTQTVNIAAEPHLRIEEARAMLSQLIRADAPLRLRFAREAALERVRYEPVMLLHRYPNALEQRNATLAHRLSKMVGLYADTPHFSSTQHSAVMHFACMAIESSDFATYRAGPMCQFFAEMLQLVETDALRTNFDDIIGPQSILWRRFRLKSHRFSADACDPLVTGENAERIQGILPTPPHLH